ncbi:MAG: tRNA (adenosine(37)-N6)-threonylcarbamoyltransferase complex ATPase subunit type 1 TsaE, partial [Pirellula staleyi]
MSIQLVSSNLELHVAEISIDDLVDCQAFAEQLASLVRTPLTIALSGTLGAGKTHWTRYFAMALGAHLQHRRGLVEV